MRRLFIDLENRVEDANDNGQVLAADKTSPAKDGK